MNHHINPINHRPTALFLRLNPTRRRTSLIQRILNSDTQGT